MEEGDKMNAPGVMDAAGMKDRVKTIRGLGLAELILGILCAVAAVIYGQVALKGVTSGDTLSWVSLGSPASLHAFHLVWTLLLVSFILSWHGILGRRLQRPLRPFGFAAGTLLSVQFTYLAIAFGFMRWEMDSINVTLNGSTVNFGSQFGAFVDVLICIVAVLAVLAACLAAFCFSQETQRALEASDQAQYTLDSIPISLFPGAVLLAYLSYSYLTDIIDPSLTLAGISLSPAMQQVTLVAFAAACAFAAWGFYSRRPWGWFAALVVGAVWTLSSYFPVSDVSTFFSNPAFDKYRALIGPLTPAFQMYIQMYDVFVFGGAILFVGYLVCVRRHFAQPGLAPRRERAPGRDVPIYADRQRLVMSNKTWLILGAISILNWLQQHYFSTLLFTALAALNAVIVLIAAFTPRCVFHEEGLALTGLSFIAVPVFPYASFKSVRLITTRKPPRPMRSIEDGVLNLNVSLFAEDQLARLEEEFKRRDIAVTVLAPEAAAA
jgi:hypothetical protein